MDTVLRTQLLTLLDGKHPPVGLTAWPDHKRSSVPFGGIDWNVRANKPVKGAIPYNPLSCIGGAQSAHYTPTWFAGPRITVSGSSRVVSYSVC